MLSIYIYIYSIHLFIYFHIAHLFDALPIDAYEAWTFIDGHPPN